MVSLRACLLQPDADHCRPVGPPRPRRRGKLVLPILYVHFLIGYKSPTLIGIPMVVEVTAETPAGELRGPPASGTSFVMLFPRAVRIDPNRSDARDYQRGQHKTQAAAAGEYSHGNTS